MMQANYSLSMAAYQAFRLVHTKTLHLQIVCLLINLFIFPLLRDERKMIGWNTPEE